MNKFAGKLLIAIAPFLVLNTARAQMPQDTIDIERIVVTVSRTQEQIKSASKFTTIIDSEDIRQSNAQNIPDILRGQAGIEVRDFTGSGKTVNVDMRGFGETGPSNMLVLIDGRRVNAIDLSNTDWSQIPLSEVEQIEIVRGASSVLYGDNASGGVVNIITKKGEGKPSAVVTAQGGSYHTVSSTVEAQAGAADGKNSFRIFGEYYDSDGYRKNSGLKRGDFAIKGSHRFNPVLSTRASFGYHQDRYGLAGALSESQVLSLGRRATTKPDDIAQTEDYYADWEWTADFRDKGRLQTNFSFRNRDIDADYFSSLWQNENHIMTFGFTPRYSLESPVLNMANTLTLGVDLYLAQDDILDGMMASANDRITITKFSQGLYVLDKIQATDRLLLRAGYRHESARYRFHQITQVDLKEKSDLDMDVFETGVVFGLTDSTSLYCDYSQSFRFPLVDEFFSSNSFGFGGLNSDLSPQKGKDVEAGIRHAFRDKGSFAFNYFRHNITNEIYFNPLTFANSNYERTVHQGIETEADLSLCANLKVFANYSYTDAYFGKGSFKGNAIPGVPRHKAGGGLRWMPREGTRLNLLVNYVGSMFLVSDQSNAYPKLNDYVTVDINASQTWKDLELFAGINNIFDAEYSEYGVLSVFSGTRNFYPAPGRRVMAGVRYHF
ncbi:MAG: TonB-dependent receptor [Candidatus Omnitrophota bacterium]